MSEVRKFDPLKYGEQMAELIALASDVPLEVAREKLAYEMKHPGRSVADDFAKRGAQRYVAGKEMDDFYTSTDAFLYELAVWNRNRLKAGMRKWIGKHLRRAKWDGGGMKVLSIGDGMGFDCLHWAKGGHDVTYFELPGKSERFARLMFERAGVSMPILTDPAAIPRGAFDAITCLDVLEHVPDPAALVQEFASYLKPGGLLYVSAPYFLILPWYPTHLRANRKFSGSLTMYWEAGLRLVGGRTGWDPIVLQKAGGENAIMDSWWEKTMVRGTGLFFLPGRFMAWPYAWLHLLRRAMNKDFV